MYAPLGIVIPDALAWGVILLILGQIVAGIAWGVRISGEVSLVKKDVEATKKWQEERMKPIEEYYHKQEMLNSRLAVVEEQSKNNARYLEKIDAKLDKQDAKLDRLIERDFGH